MPSEDLAITAGIAGAAYLAQQLFGKTLAEMGEDLSNVYKSNREKLLVKAAKKVTDPNDGAKPNLRVARDVLWNGSVTDDEVCAEYFGGLLAASRSADGKDDSSLIYVDCIKALSSKQLHLHYVIYSSLEALLVKTSKTVNPGMQDELSHVEIWFATNELTNVLGLNPVIDLNVLHRQGLVSGYALNNHIVGDKALPYTKANPTTFGILLFAAALNSLPTWNQFGQCAFTGSKEIKVPAIFASSLAELSALVGMPKEPLPPNGDSSE
jgi:hypothetical protein